MDIALCYPHVVPARGGCETYLVDLARRLADDRHTVHMYANRWDADALSGAVQVHRVKLPECLRFRRPWLFSAACLRALRDRRHDVSVGFDKSFGQDVLYPQGGLHVATIAHNHRIPAHASGRTLAQLRTWLDLGYWSFCRLERRQYLSAQRPLIVANSRMVAGHFQQHYGIGPEQLRVVPNAIDPGRFQLAGRGEIREMMRRRWQVPDEVPVALFAAMNYPLKGLEPLVRALTLIPDEVPLTVVVAGNPRTGRYRNLAERLGVGRRLRFVGFCGDMRTAYFAADFLVHPTFYDPCSLVVLEALACGLPVITSRYNGAHELLSGREGLVIEDPHDHRALARALVRLAGVGYRVACAAEARKSAEDWTFEDHYRRLLDVLREAAERRCSRRQAA